MLMMAISSGKKRQGLNGQEGAERLAGCMAIWTELSLSLSLSLHESMWEMKEICSHFVIML